jgi:hypothetical protein
VRLLLGLGEGDEQGNRCSVLWMAPRALAVPVGARSRTVLGQGPLACDWRGAGYPGRSLLGWPPGIAPVEPSQPLEPMFPVAAESGTGTRQRERAARSGRPWGRRAIQPGMV